LARTKAHHKYCWVNIMNIKHKVLKNIKKAKRWVTKTRRRKILISSLALSVLLTSIKLIFFAPGDIEAAWSPIHNSWAKRKRLTITNDSTNSLASGTAVAVSIDTKTLYQLGKVQEDCDDIRIVHQPDSSTYTNLDRYLSVPGGVSCSTNGATKVYFQLQATLASSASSNDYYIYYDNDQATAPANSDNAFDIGSKDALLVCPFDGTTTCAAAETPSTESGAIRYTGSKSALSFDGDDDHVDFSTPASTFIGSADQSFTTEGYFKLYPETYTGYYYSGRIIGNGAWTNDGGCGSAGYSVVSIQFQSNSARYLLFSLPHSYADACQSATQLTSANLSFNTWYHFATTFDVVTKEVKLYLNGTEVDSDTYGGSSTITWNGNMNFGEEGGNRYFPGVIDEIRTSNAIRYTSNFSPSTTPFVRDNFTTGLWHFDENGDDPRNTGKLIDDSGGGYHGTINGSPTYVSGLVGVNNGTTNTGKTDGGNAYAGHEGIFIEEATTNKITNPSFEHTTYDTNWSYSNPGSSPVTYNSGGGNLEGPPSIYTWFDGTRYWAMDETDDAFYFSYDGLTWTKNIAASDAFGNESRYSVWADSSNAYLVSRMAGSTSYIYVRKAVDYPSDNFSWEDAHTIDSSSDFLYNPSISKDSNNKLWVSWGEYVGSSNMTFYAVQSTNADDTSAWGSAHTLITDGGIGTFSKILPLSGGEVYALFKNFSSTNVEGCFYDPSQARFEDSGGTACDNSNHDSLSNPVGTGWDATVDTTDYDIHFVNSNISTIGYFKWDNSAGTNGQWQSEVTFSSSGTNRDVNIAIDTSSDTLYAIWNDGGSTDQQKYATCALSSACNETGDWSSDTTIGSADREEATDGSSNFADYGRIFATYVADSSTNIKFAMIETPTFTTAEETTAPYYKFGSKSAKITATDNNIFTTSINTGNTNTHTLSAYVYDGTSGNIGGTVDTTVAQLTFNGTAQTTTYTDTGGGWWRLSYSGTPGDLETYASSNQDTDQGLYASSSDEYLSQGFKVTNAQSVDRLSLYLKKVGAGTPTTTHYQVEIQTDSSGVPSGTPVTNGTSSCEAVVTSTSYALDEFTFSTDPSLSADTIYHLVLKPYTNASCTTAQPSSDGTNYIAWGYDANDGFYGAEDRSTYNGSVWSSQADDDHIFNIYGYLSKKFGIKVHDGKTIYLDGVQLEEKAYTTTYADGSLGSDYSWSGTANESTSTRDDGDLRYANNSSNISQSSGTVSLWFKEGYLDTNGHDLFAWTTTGNFADRVHFYLFGTNPGSNPHLAFYVDSAGIDCGSISKDVNPGEWHHVALTYTANSAGSDTCQIYYDGGYSSSGTTGQSWDWTPNSDIFIGALSNGTAEANSSISDLRIYDSPLSDAEIEDLYYAGLVAHSEQYEVDRFSGEKGQDPVAIWHFDESYGSTANDSSKYGNSLTLYNSSSWNTDSVGAKARLLRNLEFNGTDDIASRSADLDFNFSDESFSISGWFRHSSSISDTDTILARYEDAGYKVYMNSSGYICAAIDDDSTWTPDDETCSTSDQGSYADSKWHHFEMVKDEDTSLTLYIDAQRVNYDDTIEASGSLNSNSGIFIGADSNNSNYWAGFLDEIVIYPYARTADQVKADVFGSQTSALFGVDPKDFLTDGLVGYWKMNESSGTNVADTSGNGNDGTLTNAQETGTAEADDSTDTVVADDDNANLATANDSYNGMILRITGGGSCLPSVGEERIISDYTYDATPTRTITVSSAFSNTTDDCTFEIRHQVGGKFGKNLDFDGDNDYVDIDSSSNLDNQSSWTSTFWIYPTDHNNLHRVFCKTNATCSYPNNNKLIFMDPSGRIMANQGMEGSATDASSQTSTSLSLNAWTHVTVTFSQSDRYTRIFFNGLEQSYSTQTQGENVSISDDSSYNLTIGNRSSADRAVPGKIDDFRIYNRALTPSEISDLYNWAPGPVGYWKLEETSGTRYDSSGYGNNLTDNNTVESNIGKFGKSGDFENSASENEYLSITDANQNGLNLGTHFTLAFWLNPESLASYNQVLGKSGGGGNRGYIVDLTAGGAIELRHSEDGSSSTTTNSANSMVSTDTWVHFAIIADGSYLRLYKDGVEQTSGDFPESFSGDIYNSTSYFGIGWTETGGQYYDGMIDEARVYNYARTQEQIIEDMNAGHPAPGSPIGSALGHWKFDEGYGDTANDSGTGNNDGDLGGSGNTCPGAGASLCPAWINSGKIGKALDFGGTTTSDYVDIGDIGDFTNGTISAWAYPKFISNTAYVVTIGNGYGNNGDKARLRFNTNAIEFGIYGEGPDTGCSAVWDTASWSTTPSPNIWYHLVATWGSNGMKLYVNGNLQATHACTGDISSYTSILAGASAWSSELSGYLDEVKIYNSALTQDQVKTLFNQGFSQVFGATGTDSSGSGTWSSANEYCPPGQGSSCTAPIAEWKFDEKVNTSAYDTSENNNTGTLTNGPEWRHAGECQHGSCLFFDGASGKDQDDLVNAGTDTSIDNVFDGGGTVSGWINIASNGEIVGRILAKNGWQIYPNVSGNNLRLNLMYNYSTTNGRWYTDYGTFQLNEWTHFAIFYNSSQDTDPPVIYINGISRSITENLDASGTRDDDNTDSLIIGNVNTSGTQTIDGMIDEVRLYDYERTPAQIAWDYNRGGPVGWWRLDECSGTVANDAGSEGNNGMITIGPSSSQDEAGTCSSGDSSHAWNNGTDGKVNYSLNFDGADDNIEISNNYSSEDVTMSFWIKPGGGASSDHAMNKYLHTGDGWGVRISTGNIEIWDDIDNADAFIYATPYTNDTWYHVVAVMDSLENLLYVNGRLVGSGSFSSDGFDSFTGNLFIGSRYTTGGFVPGQIDDARIYNYALTQKQILDVMNYGAIHFGPN